jgi:hypothetical protein
MTGKDDDNQVNIVEFCSAGYPIFIISLLLATTTVWPFSQDLSQEVIDEVLEGVLLVKGFHKEEVLLIGEVLTARNLDELPVLGVKAAQCPIKDRGHSAVVHHDVSGLDIAMSVMNLVVTV